jgi:hypothetical protein
MPNRSKGLDGFDEPINPDDGVEKLEPEYIRDLAKLVVVESIESKKKIAKYKRSFASWFVFGSLVVLAAMLTIGSLNGDFTAAEKWGGFIGPLVGFQIHAIFFSTENERS